MPQQKKEPIIVPIHKEGGNTDFNNYRGICLLSTTYKILSNILPVSLTPYVNEVICDHQCEFHRNRSKTDQILYIRQVLQKKREYNGTMHQPFIQFQKVYDSVKREVLYNILLEFGVPKKRVGLVEMCLNETYRNIRVGKILSDKFPFQKGPKQGDAPSPFLLILL
jgi:hypothetical protein